MEKEKNKKSTVSQSSGATAYLVGYNVLQFVGWTTIFYFTCSHLLLTRNVKTLWRSVHVWLRIFQTMALLEVVHSFVGLIRSNPLITFIQIYSRVFVVWCIAGLVKQAEVSYGVPLLLFAWCITEIVRYSYYFLNLVSNVPQFLIWCRYTFFIVLYPCGVLGEMICMYLALPHFKCSRMWSIDLPNRFNFSFSFYYFVILYMVSYIPGKVLVDANYNS